MFSFFKKKNIEPKAKLQQVLGSYTLPSFPIVVMRVLETIRNPRASAADVADVLSMDPGLSVQVLKTVNSSAYSPRHKIEAVPQAVAILGLATLETLVLSLAIVNVIPRTPKPGYDFQRFWRTSVQRAFIARSFADVLHPAQKSHSFTAGLLQDMAVPFLASEKPDDYGQLLEQWHSGSDDLAQLERSTLDWDHAEVATWLCNEWDLPESLAISIGESHGTLDLGGQCPAAVSLVSCLREQDGENPATNVNPLIEMATTHYHIAPEVAVQLVESSLQEAKEFVRAL